MIVWIDISHGMKKEILEKDVSRKISDKKISEIQSDKP